MEVLTLSLDFEFDCKSKGWEAVFHYVGGYCNHGSNFSRNLKGFTVWKTPSGELYAEVLLTQNKSTLIDYDLLDFVCQSNWVAAKDGFWGYRVTRYTPKGEGGDQLLHRLLFKEGCNEGLIIDHINNDFPNSYALDNRRCNIRYTFKNTHNVRKYTTNTSGYTGIIPNRYNKLTVQVTLDKKRPYVPYYGVDALDDALLCRDMFKVVLHTHYDDMEDRESIIKEIIDLYDGKKLPSSKPEKDTLELFRQIHIKDSLDLPSKIDLLRQRVKDSL